MPQLLNEPDLSPSRKKGGSNLKKWVIRTIILLALVVAAIYLSPMVAYYLTHESSDDAYVTGTIVPISAEVKGRVTQVYIQDNQAVEAGTPLFEIERDDYAARVEEAEKALLRMVAEQDQIRASLKEGKEARAAAQAELESAKAQEDYALKEKTSNKELASRNFVPRLRYDQVVSQWQVAKARTEAARAAVSKAEAAIQSLEAQLKTQAFKIEEAKAGLSLARIDLGRTQIRAPISGWIARKNVDPGKYVQPGQPLFSIVEKEVWVVANFKETQIEKMKVGQPVEIEVDAYPGVAFKGHISSFQPGTGAVFSLLPPENATGNFVKIVQRVPVKIVFDSVPDPMHPLWPGLSVVPHVKISEK